MVLRSASGVISPASERRTETSRRTEVSEASAVSRTVIRVVRSRSSPPRARPVAACTLIVVRLCPTRSWSSLARLRRSAATAWAAAMPTSRAWFSAILLREEASRWVRTTTPAKTRPMSVRAIKAAPFQPEPAVGSALDS